MDIFKQKLNERLLDTDFGYDEDPLGILEPAPQDEAGDELIKMLFYLPTIPFVKLYEKSYYSKLARRVDKCIQLGADPDARYESSQNTLAHEAAYHGAIPVLAVLKKRNGDLNACNKINQTPIFDAVDSDNISTYEWLKKNGANRFHLDNEKRNLMFFASSVKMAKLLVKDGINPFQTDKNGCTPAECDYVPYKVRAYLKKQAFEDLLSFYSRQQQKSK